VALIAEIVLASRLRLLLFTKVCKLAMVFAIVSRLVVFREGFS